MPVRSRPIMVLIAAVLAVGIAAVAVNLVEKPAHRPAGQQSPRVIRPIVDCPAIEVRFSPGGGCEAAIVAEIGGASRLVRVQAFSFTSRPIAEALVAAKARGVDVAVCLDKGQPDARGTQIPAMLGAGIPVLIDARHAIFHDKSISIDGNIVITGSYNFTSSAEHVNAENSLVIRDVPTAAKYAANWSLHAAHSTPYLPPR